MTTSNEITRKLENQRHTSTTTHNGWTTSPTMSSSRAPCSTANCVVQNRSGRC